MQNKSPRRAAARPRQAGLGSHLPAPTHIVGVGTAFREQLSERDSIALPKNLGSAEIFEIISDTELVLKKDLTKDLQVLEVLTSSEGSAYKCLPYIDQGDMYRTVYDRLNAGECVGIFPEGGSHDRYEMLPLKAGVCIMALGAMAEHPGLDVKIVPCGLNYLHPHKFRSRAVIEFGDPITIPTDLVDRFLEGGAAKRDACGKLLEVIYQALKTVTVNAGDYETLMVIQAGRRLYRPAHKKLSTAKILELNRRFIAAYELLKDKPEVQEIKEKVMAYNKMLKYYGLRDHQVKKTQIGGTRALALLVYRTISLTIMGMFALPGAILNAPIAVIAKIISHRKAKEALAASTVKIAGRDVLATWKLLVALVLLPLFYWLYAFIVLLVAIHLDVSPSVKISMPLITLCLLPFVSYASVRFGETSLDILRSLRPLFLSLFPGSASSVRNLRQVREELSRDLTALIDQHAPAVFPNLEKNRIITKEDLSVDANGQPAAAPSTLARLQWLVNLPGAVSFQWLANLPGTVSSYARTTPLLSDSVFNWADVGTDDTADDVFFFQNNSAESGDEATISGSSSPDGYPSSPSPRRSRSPSFGEGLNITSISLTPASSPAKSSKKRSATPHRSSGNSTPPPQNEQ
ncbi:MAG: hypothetical protein BJ554DRAFT_1819 [Olpidium bornovanus]|uniref:Phospholipid/glycerol acyltransferase domain-containing protein n=1 Tax=Olpidium bornovanus TaxID=278681 RepID=A0A8H7ZR08_9FUNG|nr:MAG: hypothetical protein BJ554DRAFT_1819 [Olpidium bornovanus]